MTKTKELSVFFPAYNEEDRIEETVKKSVKVLKAVAEKWEVLIVDDGSIDATPEIAKALSQKIKGVRVITHKVNQGYGASLKSGFYAAKYGWIAFTDSDGQFDFAELTRFLDKQEETSADLVIGYYKKRRVTFSKVITSRMWELLVFLLFGLRVRDIDCGFKLVNRKVIESLSKLESERGAFISSELLIKAKKKGFRIVEVPVSHYPRKTGAGTGRDINVILSSFRDLFRLWRKL